jgi:hypothetical protein
LQHKQCRRFGKCVVLSPDILLQLPHRRFEFCPSKHGCAPIGVLDARKREVPPTEKLIKHHAFEVAPREQCITGQFHALGYETKFYGR